MLTFIMQQTKSLDKSKFRGITIDLTLSVQKSHLHYDLQYMWYEISSDLEIAHLYLETIFKYNSNKLCDILLTGFTAHLYSVCMLIHNYYSANYIKSALSSLSPS